MLSHTHLGMSDLSRAVTIYDAVMDALDYTLKIG